VPASSSACTSNSALASTPPPAASRAPHWLQNRAPMALSCWQVGHRFGGGAAAGRRAVTTTACTSSPCRCAGMALRRKAMKSDENSG
jgi:hypothetical protein